MDNETIIGTSGKRSIRRKKVVLTPQLTPTTSQVARVTRVGACKKMLLEAVKRDHKYYKRPSPKGSNIQFVIADENDNYVEILTILSVKSRVFTYKMILSDWGDDDHVAFTIMYVKSNGTVLAPRFIKPKVFKKLFKYTNFDKTGIVTNVIKIPRTYQMFTEMTLFEAPILQALASYPQKMWEIYKKLIK